MEISFIIPHKGRHAMLVETVTSIARQNYTLEDIQVIIISENSEINQQTFEGALFERLSLHIEHHSGDNISAMRNAGAHISNGKYLAFIDADIKLSENWLNELLQLLKSKTTDLAASCQTVGQQDNFIDHIRAALSSSLADSFVEQLPGANLILEKKLFNKIGGFPEHLTTCEDIYFTKKVSEIGKIFLTSSEPFIHLGEDKNPRELFRKEIWRGQSNLQSLAGREFAWSELPSILSPLGVAFCSVIVVMALLLGEFMWMLFALFCIFIPIAAYSIRLKLGAGQDLPNLSIAKFYTVYLAARAIGIVSGLSNKLGSGKSDNDK
jgi:glycosyltransferase involved in cell wall biosynthesis